MLLLDLLYASPRPLSSSLVSCPQLHTRDKLGPHQSVASPAEQELQKRCALAACIYLCSKCAQLGLLLTVQFEFTQFVGAIIGMINQENNASVAATATDRTITIDEIKGEKLGPWPVQVGLTFTSLTTKI